MFVRLENSRSGGVGLLSRRFLFTTGVEQVSSIYMGIYCE
jgi:hypothetical protein